MPSIRPPLRRHEVSECPLYGARAVSECPPRRAHISKLYNKLCFLRHEMTKNWSHYGDGRLASALIKIVAYWRMPPSFPDQKIDLFKKKVCPNRTIRSKVTSFFKITKCTRTFHSWPKNVKTRWSDLGKFFEIGLFFQPETMKASSNSQHFLELGGTH